MGDRTDALAMAIYVRAEWEDLGDEVDDEQRKLFVETWATACWEGVQWERRRRWLQQFAAQLEAFGAAAATVRVKPIDSLSGQASYTFTWGPPERV